MKFNTLDKKILIIAPAWVGDLVMAQTLFKLLRSKYQSGLTLDIFASKFLHPIISRMPEIDNIIENSFQHKELKLRQRIRFGLNLRKKKYDEVIILPNSIKSAIMPFFAGIKKRTGFIGESRYILINNYYKLDKTILPLMIDRFCALANEGNKVIDINFPLLKIDTNNQGILRRQFNLDKNKIMIAFCPAAEYGLAKRWPPEYFARLANLLDSNIYQIVILGSKKDKEIAEQILECSNFPIVNLCGKTDLKDVVDILALCEHTITNDSGLMHTAASVNSHIIAIYGSTSENFTPPLTKNAEIVKINLECSPCFARTCKFGHYNCLKMILPEMILEKISLAKNFHGKNS